MNNLLVNFINSIPSYVSAFMYNKKVETKRFPRLTTVKKALYEQCKKETLGNLTVSEQYEVDAMIEDCFYGIKEAESNGG